jgi:hypothetical protein
MHQFPRFAPARRPRLWRVLAATGAPSWMSTSMRYGCSFFSAGVVDHWPQTFDVVQFLLSDIYASCFGVLDSAPFDF